MKFGKIILLFFILALVVAGWLFFTRGGGKYTGVYIPVADRTVPGTKIAGEEVPGILLPEGFRMVFFAKDLPNARVIEFDPGGRMLVSQTKSGKITLLENGEDGIAGARKTLLEGLRNPHGMAWECPSDEERCLLYVAESDKLTRYAYDAEAGEVSQKEILADLPYSSFDNHFTRSLLFLPYPKDHILLVSIGSTCNVCVEKDSRYAKILAYDTIAGTLEEYASGLRNAVFMALDPLFGKVFVTEMGRDMLGDDLPPDEINIVERGNNYGWPICYGKNVHDTNFDKNTYIRNPCMEPFETPSFADLQAHSAPLGLAFVPEEGWPEEYWYDILVAYHGSWNRSIPTGYKIARLKMNARGEYEGTEDFITGWLKDNGRKIGRPVDVKIFPGGVMYISDDLAGAVYKVFREFDE